MISQLYDVTESVYKVAGIFSQVLIDVNIFVVHSTSSLGMRSLSGQYQHFKDAIAVPSSLTAFLPQVTEEFHFTHRH